MARVLKNKKLVDTKLATNYGGWMYCNKCNENIGYLCYSTYDRNRLCCPKDNEPLITILDKKVHSYEMKITCKFCESIYKKVK